MLQQTQVGTVIPYYRRFLKRFPNLKRLAEAPEEQVLAAWSGLGYYRRARLLQRGAQFIHTQLGGKIPAEASGLIQIPGVGKYTAGAVASIAFHQPTPVVDGNIIRVYARFFALKGHAKESALQKKIWQVAGAMMGRKNPGDFNQALMELGATVCRPAWPDCDLCPLQRDCAGFATGFPEEFPERAPAGKTQHLQRLAVVGRRGGKILLVKKRAPRWFRGMWELPHTIGQDLPPQPGILKSTLFRDLGIGLKKIKAVEPTRHSITHHRITTHAWTGEITGRPKKNKVFENIDFFPIIQLKNLPLSNFDRKVLQASQLLT